MSLSFCHAFRLSAPLRVPNLTLGSSSVRFRRPAGPGPVLQQLSQGADVNLGHLQSLRFGQLLLALQVRDDAPQPVERHVQSEHPSPLPGVGGQAPPPLRPLQGAPVRLQVVQGGAQPELHDGARGRLAEVTAVSGERRLGLLLRSGPLQQGVHVPAEIHGGRGADPALRSCGDEGRKQAFTRRHVSTCSSEEEPEPDGAGDGSASSNVPNSGTGIYGPERHGGDAACVNPGAWRRSCAA